MPESSDRIVSLPAATSQDVLTSILRDGAQRLLTQAIELEVAEWIDRWVPKSERLRSNLPLFRNPGAKNKEKRWTPASERRVLLAAMAEAGAYFKPNELGRHAFGTHAAKRGAQAFALQKFMGHTDPRTTSRYIDLSGAALLDVLRPSGQ